MRKASRLTDDEKQLIASYRQLPVHYQLVFIETITAAYLYDHEPMGAAETDKAVGGGKVINFRAAARSRRPERVSKCK